MGKIGTIISIIVVLVLIWAWINRNKLLSDMFHIDDIKDVFNQSLKGATELASGATSFVNKTTGGVTDAVNKTTGGVTGAVNKTTGGATKATDSIRKSTSKLF